MLMRYVAALILTVLLLGIARRISTRHPTDYSVEASSSELDCYIYCIHNSPLDLIWLILKN